MALSKFIEKFRTVALERVDRLDGLLVGFEGQERNDELVDEIARELHTLKGESKMLGFSDVNLVAHLTEDIVQRDDSDSELLEEGFEVLRSLLTKSTGAMAEPIDLVGFVVRAQSGVTAVTRRTRKKTASSVSVSPPLHSGIRVELSKLENVADVASELILSSRTLNYQLELLREARQDVDQWLSQNSDLLPQALQREAEQRFSRLGSLTADLFGVVQSVEGSAGLLEEQSRQLRHVRVEVLFQHYPRAVRDLAKATGKEIQFSLSLGDVEVDRSIVDGLSEPMLHLLRNAADHGLETPDDRIAAGKSPTGQLQVSAHYTGSTIDLELRDDGRGIDPASVSTVAIERGIVTADEIEEMSDADIIALIFESGFSTKHEVNDLSGRGMGMDIVRRGLARLGGTIGIESEVGVGTAFRIRVPISGLVGSIVEFRLGNRRLCVAGRDILQIVSIDASELQRTEHGLGVLWHDEVYEVSDWRVALGVRGAGIPHGKTTLFLGKNYRQRFAFWVDELLEERTAITRPMDGFFDGLAVIDGLAVTDTGETIPVIGIPGLLSRGARPSGATRIRQTSQVAAIKRKVVKSVLVVEDSEITRSLIAGTLREHGYQVTEAEDGGFAIEQLAARVFDLIVSDVQMPRMDGITLVKTIRQMKLHKTTPVIMLTTLGSADDKLRAMNAGASAYLVKLNFRESELIETARRLTSD